MASSTGQTQSSPIDLRIGVAIATHNSADVIERCLRALGDEFQIVLFDDGSEDHTVDLALAVNPSLVVLEGDGTHWWAGGTRRAAEKCLELGCDFVVLLNPDVEFFQNDVLRLVKKAAERELTIMAPLVLNRFQKEHIAWAGSRFVKLPWLPVYTQRYVFKSGTSVETLQSEPYLVDEAHGRGVVIPKAVFEKIGFWDDKTFPHYGADNDFSWRARNAGIEIKVDPTVQVYLDVRNTGMSSEKDASWSNRLKVVHRYLTERKNGEALRVWWHLMKRHVPRHAIVPSYLFNLSLNVLHRLR